MRIQRCYVGIRGPDRKGTRQSGKDGESLTPRRGGETYFCSHFAVATLDVSFEEYLVSNACQVVVWIARTGQK